MALFFKTLTQASQLGKRTSMFHSTYRLSDTIRSFAHIFHKHGFSCYLVGGAVRNIVAKQQPSDYDFATDATPDEVIAIFRKVIPTGIQHGTVTVLFKGEQFEVTTFRIDDDYSDGRRPDSVTYTADIYEDLARRDFTINAMAVDIKSGDLVDPQDGRRDIKRKVIRAIGVPEKRFHEDGLRIMRACRFTAQLDFSIEEDTEAAMKSCKKQLDQVSPERIREELLKMLSADSPSKGFYAMERTGILEDLLPELARCRGVEQKGYHDYDVLDHSLLACDGAPRSRPEIRLAALFHDIGKPDSLAYDELGIPTFFRHEVYSEKICRAIMERYRFPKAITESVCHLIRHHMFHYTEEWSDAAVRRFLVKTGPDTIDDLFILRRADQYGMGAKAFDSHNLMLFSAHIKKVLSEDNALSVKDLAVDGKDLIDLGITPGPLLGRILEELLDTVIDDPAMNTKERLLGVAKSLYDRCR